MTSWGNEQQVVHAFGAWLVNHGWTVQFKVDWQDILAERRGHRLHVEAKGRTTSAGLDIDTAYGQLLRRMPTTDNPLDTYAVVIPTNPDQSAQPPAYRHAYGTLSASHYVRSLKTAPR